MFLLMMIVIFSIVWFASQVDALRREKRSKRWAQQDGRSWYHDRNGQMVDTKTDVPYRYSQQYTYSKELGWHYDDLKMVQAYSGKTIRNISDERRQRKEYLRALWRAEAEQKGDMYYRYDLPDESMTAFYGYTEYRRGYLPKTNAIFAHRYTGKKYAIFGRSGFNFLWSVDTKRLEGIVDEDKLSPEELEKARACMDECNKLYSSGCSLWESGTSSTQWAWNLHRDEPLSAYKDLRKYQEYILMGKPL